MNDKWEWKVFLYHSFPLWYHFVTYTINIHSKRNSTSKQNDCSDCWYIVRSCPILFMCTLIFSRRIISEGDFCKRNIHLTLYPQYSNTLMACIIKMMEYCNMTILVLIHCLDDLFWWDQLDPLKRGERNSCIEHYYEIFMFFVSFYSCDKDEMLNDVSSNSWMDFSPFISIIIIIRI